MPSPRLLASVCLTLLAAEIPPVPDGLSGWLACGAYVLAGAWLIMQLIQGSRGKQQEWVTQTQLDNLSHEIQRRDDDRTQRLSHVVKQLDALTATMSKGFQDVERSIGRLEGRDLR